MDKYAVSKQYGHFVQVWEVDAENENEAWNKAESHGKLKYQTVYSNIYPVSNYVTCLSNPKNNNTIDKEQYDIWLKEAIDLGMDVDDYKGLPFNDVR
jgi:hypothetical protein